MKDLVTTPLFLTFRPWSPSPQPKTYGLPSLTVAPSPLFKSNIPYPLVSEIVLSNSPSAGCPQPGPEAATLPGTG